jgi:Tol biopolymer transport system component
MNGDTRIERQLPLILADLGAGPTPDYTETLLARTSATSQRPGWVFPERWLPMSAITERMATAPRVPLRAAALVALLILVLAAAALYVGSQQRRLPEPFGPAANGLISYMADGDIYVADPVTGATRLLIGGPENDYGPGFSPDGTRMAFFREAGSDTALVVANEDGSDLRTLATYPTDEVPWVNWAPDSRGFAVISRTLDADTKQLDLVDATGTGTVETIATIAGLDYVQFRPPDGREILYRAEANGTDGLYAMNADGTNVHALVERPGGSLWAGWAVYSPDGGRIFYTRDYENASSTGTCCALWVMDADGGDPHEFIRNQGTAWDGTPVVSPDGSKVAFWHVADTGQVSVARADGTGQVIPTGPMMPNDTPWLAWAPDSSKILLYPNGSTSTYAYLLDPEGGQYSRVSWQSDDGNIDWQRVGTD